MEVPMERTEEPRQEAKDKKDKDEDRKARPVSNPHGKSFEKRGQERNK